MMVSTMCLQTRQELEKVRRRLELEVNELREQLADKMTQLEECQSQLNRREEELQMALNKLVIRDDCHWQLLCQCNDIYNLNVTEMVVCSLHQVTSTCYQMIKYMQCHRASEFAFWLINYQRNNNQEWGGGVDESQHDEDAERIGESEAGNIGRSRVGERGKSQSGKAKEGFRRG